MGAHDLAQVRQFNRTAIQWISSMDEDFARGNRSLGEYRALHEIGVNGADIPILSSRLQLNRHELSLLLLDLEESGMVEMGHRASEIQVDRARLTTAGREALKVQERRADAAAQGALDSLNFTQRERLLEAMRKVEQLIRASTVELRVADPHNPHFQDCLDAYFSELADRYGGFDPDLSRSIAPEQMVPPAGLLLMAYHRDHPVGCGVLNYQSDGIGAIKRMWVSPEYRGVGIGSRILDELERRARINGVRILRLENRDELHEAVRMYKQFGYREVEPFNDEFYADRWYEKALTDLR